MTLGLPSCNLFASLQDDVVLAGGKTIERFLVVNKVSLYFEKEIELVNKCLIV